MQALLRQAQARGGATISSLVAPAEQSLNDINHLSARPVGSADLPFDKITVAVKKQGRRQGDGLGEFFQQPAALIVIDRKVIGYIILLEVLLYRTPFVVLAQGDEFQALIFMLFSESQ